MDVYYDGKCLLSGELWVCVIVKMIEVYDFWIGKMFVVYEVLCYVKWFQVVVLLDSKQDIFFICVVVVELCDVGWRIFILVEDENIDDGISEGFDFLFIVMFFFFEYDQ